MVKMNMFWALVGGVRYVIKFIFKYVAGYGKERRGHS